MTVGYVVAFGGVLAIMIIGLLAEALLQWLERRNPTTDPPQPSVDLLLADAAIANKRVEADIERVRSLLTAPRES